MATRESRKYRTAPTIRRNGTIAKKCALPHCKRFSGLRLCSECFHGINVKAKDIEDGRARIEDMKLGPVRDAVAWALAARAEAAKHPKAA